MPRKKPDVVPYLSHSASFDAMKISKAVLSLVIPTVIS